MLRGGAGAGGLNGCGGGVPAGVVCALRFGAGGAGGFAGAYVCAVPGGSAVPALRVAARHERKLYEVWRASQDKSAGCCVLGVGWVTAGTPPDAIPYDLAIISYREENS